MRVIELSGPPDEALALSFARFEALFDYPLGPSQRFRVVHDADPTAFFRAMGEGRTWLVEDRDILVAALSAAVRPIVIGGVERRIAYLGDLKIHPGHRGRRVLFHLAEQAMPWLKTHADIAYGVVMEGTVVTPDRYSGALGIPAFEPVADLHVLRFSTDIPLGSARASAVSYEGYRQLQPLSYPAQSDSGLRSTMAPIWLGADGASGMVEDTRRAKRLVLDGGEELLSAHLSHFAFADGAAGRSVIDQALACARARGFPALFLALPQDEYDRLASHLADLSWTAARAAVYATDPCCARLPILSAEI